MMRTRGRIVSFLVGLILLLTFIAYRPFSYNHQRKYAIVSTIQTPGFLTYSAPLIYSLKKYNDLDKMDVDLIMLVRTEGENALSPQDVQLIESIGWQIRDEPDIEIPDFDRSKMWPQYIHNLNRFYFWKWSEYERILYIDADMLCKNPLGDVFLLPGIFAAANDSLADRAFVEGINAGAILITPGEEAYQHLLGNATDQSLLPSGSNDQTFLERYYAGRTTKLSPLYNVNLILYSHHPDVWFALWDDAKIVHYTMYKPKTGSEACINNADCNYKEPALFYHNMCKEAFDYYGWTGKFDLLG